MDLSTRLDGSIMGTRPFPKIRILVISSSTAAVN